MAIFENTYIRLDRCIEHIENKNQTSIIEKEYAKYLYEECKTYIAAYEHYGIKDIPTDNRVN